MKRGTGLPGVAAVHADIRKDRATVSYDASLVTPWQMVEALRKPGYQARWPAPAPPAQARER